MRAACGGGLARFGAGPSEFLLPYTPPSRLESRNDAGQMLNHTLKARWLSRAYVGKGKPNPSAPHRFCLLVAGMGDLNAVGVASRMHEGLLDPVGLLDPICKLEFGKEFPVSKN